MTDEEILAITRDVWESFTGREIELTDDQLRPTAATSPSAA
jgi:hypothetical protein